MKEEIVRNLKKLRNPQELKLSAYSKYLEDAIKYIQNVQPRKPMKKEGFIEKEWLQKKIIEDMVKGKCDGLVLRKVNYYIYLYEKEIGVNG
jgi:hypothetical protein